MKNVWLNPDTQMRIKSKNLNVQTRTNGEGRTHLSTKLRLEYVEIVVTKQNIRIKNIDNIK